MKWIQLQPKIGAGIAQQNSNMSIDRVDDIALPVDHPETCPENCGGVLEYRRVVQGYYKYVCVECGAVVIEK